MAEGDDLIDEAFLFVSEKKCPDGASTTRKKIIRKKEEKFVIIDGELYYYIAWKRKEDKTVKICKIKVQLLLALL